MKPSRNPFLYLTVILAAALALFLIFDKDPVKEPDVKPHLESIKAKDARIATLEAQVQALSEEQRESDSLYYAKAEVFKTRLERLNRKLASIDTKNATVPELDSILLALYE